MPPLLSPGERVRELRHRVERRRVVQAERASNREIHGHRRAPVSRSGFRGQHLHQEQREL
jgi:hypothetical protein